MDAAPTQPLDPTPWLTAIQKLGWTNAIWLLAALAVAVGFALHPAEVIRALTEAVEKMVRLYREGRAVDVAIEERRLAVRNEIEAARARQLTDRTGGEDP